MNTERRWLDSYPSGVPRQIDVQRFPSLCALLAHSVERFGDRPAITSFGAVLNYAQLDDLSREFSSFLQGRLGLQRGERFAIMLPNLIQYPVALFGALRAGLTVVNVNPLYTASELREQLADSGASAIIVLENFARTVQDALAGTAVRHVLTTQIGDALSPVKRFAMNAVIRYVKRMVPPWRIDAAIDYRDALAIGRKLAVPDATPQSADIAFLQYTGGTTGRSRGAMLTHANMVANVEQTAAWIGSILEEGRETVITALPLYHVFALTANLLVFTRLGGNNVLVANPRDIPRFVALLGETAFSAVTGVNTLFNALLHAPGFESVCRTRRAGLKVCVAGGTALQRSVAEGWHAAMGVPLIEGYGLTEASPIVCANPLDAPAYTGTIGLPLPGTDVSIRAEDGSELAANEIGEICVRGPQVMRGYWNAPQETAQAFSADGWLRTGDLGRMDERGYVQFTDRRKDVIVVSGFKAYPTEIEDVAMLHPGVADAGAIGIPDERSGEVVALYVVRRDPALGVDELKAHCAQHLTGYKLPHVIEFRDSLPKTPIGKVLRRELREQPHV